MTNIIIQISKYVLMILMLIFTLESFLVLGKKTEEEQRAGMRRQILGLLMFNTIAYVVMYLATRSAHTIYLYLQVMAYILIVQVLYRLIYKKASLVLVNNMCMLISVGIIILGRLDVSTKTDRATTQIRVIAAATLISFLIPVIIRRVKFVRDLTWFYAVVGILLLAAVFAIAHVMGGAKLSISIGGISFQFSEFVKITFVFFMAGIMQSTMTFRQVVLASVVAAIHVGILVLSTDLGTALVFFASYLVIIYVSTRRARYAFAGLVGITGASVAAYHMFNHVKQRVSIWKDPFATYETTGYQIVQALFGLSAGGWFGTGLFKGKPQMIPLASMDFTFAAICEEFGLIFAISLILLCMSTFLLIVNISMKLSKRFYRLIAMGLGTQYAVQVFLTIGGTIKFIPMTGITLPLVSYGGSSAMSTIIMLSIIQGLYVMRDDVALKVKTPEKKQKKPLGKRAQTKKQLEEKIRLEEERKQQERRRLAKATQPDAGRKGKGQEHTAAKSKREQTDELEKRIEEETKKSLHW